MLLSFLSLNSKTMSAEFATSLLCVTTITHLFLSFANFLSISIISPAVSTSRFPVGSSATIIEASLAIARAMATLCCSPPESSFGKLLYLSSKPNILSNSIDLFFKSIR